MNKILKSIAKPGWLVALILGEGADASTIRAGTSIGIMYVPNLDPDGTMPP